MCRWVAYFGSPLTLDEVLVKPDNSLVQQSRQALQGVESTNGDGFGMGWYGDGPEPGLFHSTRPAWNDSNLVELAAHVKSGLFFGHIRASTGTAVQRTNCHPFRVGRWMWMHNGVIEGFAEIKRELVFAIEPELYPALKGSTDSEVMFLLALTLGLDDDPPGAVARMVALVEETGRGHGIEEPVQMTVATSDGEAVWAFRYSSRGESRSLYHSADVRTLRRMYPDIPAFQMVSDEARLVVSEPLGELEGAWREIPERSWVRIAEGPDEMHPFSPAR